MSACTDVGLTSATAKMEPIGCVIETLFGTTPTTWIRRLTSPLGVPWDWWSAVYYSGPGSRPKGKMPVIVSLVGWARSTDASAITSD